MISSFVRALVSAFKARRELALENVALRQQLAVLPPFGETAAALECRPRVLGAVAGCAPQKVDPALIARSRPAMIAWALSAFVFLDTTRYEMLCRSVLELQHTKSTPSLEISQTRYVLQFLLT